MVAALAIASCLVSGCASRSGAPSADAHWAAMMVPHHEAGVALDDLALARTDDVRVRRLAFEMNGYQGRELDELRRLAGGADGSSMAEGMPSADELAALGRLTGADFDRTFLALMIRHHEGAVRMSLRDGRAPGTSAATRRLADRVVAVQADQLGRMRELLAELGGEGVTA